MIPHLLHPRDPRQAVCEIPADQILRRETEEPPRSNHTCDDVFTLLPTAARPDDANRPVGNATLIDAPRRVVTERRHPKIDGVLVDTWSAGVTAMIWDNLRDDTRQRLLRMPSHELILWCVEIYASLPTRRGNR